MLRKIRIGVAVILFTLITLLFLDFTGTLHGWFGWLAKIQLLPALLALNLGVGIGLVVLTLLFGRIYCSTICPLGVMQDIFAHFGKRHKKNRYGYSPAKHLLRYTMLVLFGGSLAAGGVASVAVLARLLAPYSAYGRIAQNLLAPLYNLGNNLLAYLAERMESYAVYSTEVWVRNWATFAVAAATLLILGILAWRNGRTYCNTICPVGTVLGWVSRFSWWHPTIDTDKCNGCGLCARNCKSACIDAKHHAIDLSRCVACMDCLESCKQGAIRYEHRNRRTASAPTATSDAGTAPQDKGRRRFLIGMGIAVAGAARAQEKGKTDGGLAELIDRKVPPRTTPVVPPGGRSLRLFTAHCTGCQLCVEACPNGVLRPSGELGRFMQPELSFERGFCRPECTKCGEVCPTGAIHPITTAEKSATQIGHAVWVRENCVVLTDGVKCGNCARHCPTGAIRMLHSRADDPASPLIPAVDTERCIGCGSCETHCPSRPFSAIVVEGHEEHRTL